MPYVDMKETGKRIDALRRKHNLTVKELQDLLGLETPQSIYKWQRGETLPNIENLLILAQALQSTVEDIVVLKKEK